MGKNNIIQKLEHRWEINSGFQVVLILIVFSCTGFTVLFAEKLIHDLLQIPADLAWFVDVLLFIVITLPLYNLLLLVYGFLFGQFSFFWKFEKRFFVQRKYNFLFHLSHIIKTLFTPLI